MAKAEYRSAVRSRKLINAALGDLLQEKPLDRYRRGQPGGN